MQTSKNLRFRTVKPNFNGRFVQVASAVKNFGTLSPMLSVAEKVTLSHKEHNQSSEWHSEVDRTQGRELL
jgi:hypothetical protein